MAVVSDIIEFDATKSKTISRRWDNKKIGSANGGDNAGAPEMASNRQQ